MSVTFVREGCKPVVSPSERKLMLDLSRTRMSFANLTNEVGQFLQVAGGPGLFLLERRDPDGKHYRASQDKAVAQHPDGTVLAFSGGNVLMAQRDWFLIQQVVEVFVAFSEKRDWPTYVGWREVNLGMP
jgi:hypothetical protein